ncbi:response regulator [Sporosarcina sp. JAI121]|uniref:response regulator n=1 Tax=Sporosarcina sp. JAI121 TaxID=2723064 RepID=UPI0015C70124|nr:response regulator [Sporosarcina sp. JAI121]NYF23352.1 two-component system CitB family response regulator [Sporosarcina sp. JAI121]
MTNPIEILIIEDDRRIADIHKRFIEKIDGFTVVGSAHTGDEAKDWIASLLPDLVLLDVYLPDVLGTELMGFIHENSPETDIIFITAAAEIEIVKKAFRHGVIDYILKPLTFDRFRESLLSYKEKRETLAGEGLMQEDTIKSLWNKAPSASSNPDIIPPKGIDPITKEKVVSHIKNIEGGITAETLGLEIGVSRSTARRYLEYLVTEKRAFTELLYGSVGRPERRYFIKKR